LQLLTIIGNYCFQFNIDNSRYIGIKLNFGKTILTSQMHISNALRYILDSRGGEICEMK